MPVVDETSNKFPAEKDLSDDINLLEEGENRDLSVCLEPDALLFNLNEVYSDIKSP